MSKIGQKFEIGDKVKVINNYKMDNLPLWEEYIVAAVIKDLIYLEDKETMGNGFHPWRFDLVQSKPSFDLHSNPWYIRIENEEQFNLANEWLKENFGNNLRGKYIADMQYITNCTDAEDADKHLMHGSNTENKVKHAYEVKLNFKTTISSVEFPVVEIETEQQKRIRELKATIDSASKQLEELMKETK